MNEPTSQSQNPLLKRLLLEKGLPLKGIYTNQDVARIFAVSVRTVQDWERAGKLRARQLPGRGRCLSGDLELCLKQSLKLCRGGDDE